MTLYPCPHYSSHSWSTLDQLQMSPAQRAVVPFQVTSKDRSISYWTHEVALSCRCTWTAHLRATGRHLCKGTPNHLPPSLPPSLSPSLLSSFLFLTPSSPLSIIHTIFLSLASYIITLLLQDHICTSLPTHSFDLIYYTSFICVRLQVCPRNRAFISVVTKTNQINK